MSYPPPGSSGYPTAPPSGYPGGPPPQGYPGGPPPPGYPGGAPPQGYPGAQVYGNPSGSMYPGGGAPPGGPGYPGGQMYPGGAPPQGYPGYPGGPTPQGYPGGPGGPPLQLYPPQAFAGGVKPVGKPFYFDSAFDIRFSALMHYRSASSGGISIPSSYNLPIHILCNGSPYFHCASVPSPLGYGHSFNLSDMAGNSICYIQPDMSLGMPHFHIYLRGALYATVKQDWSSYEKKFEVHNKQTGEHLKVHGDWFAQAFEFRRHHGAQVAVVSGGGYNGDMYDVTVYPGEDALFVLAATLTIEKLCHEHKHHHKHNW